MNLAKLPQHIAIIMDGNGRWATQRKQNRTFGHSAGVERAREITRECAKLGVKALTLYTFSTENWQRPPLEINFLMRLLLRYLRNESKELIENNIRFKSIGLIHMLPKEIQQEITRLEELTKNNTGLHLNLALSYGSRQELLEAVKAVASLVKNEQLQPTEIDETTFSRFLFTANMPELDLLIRTGGDHRISNFLLWQAAYAELFFTEVCWPDFDIEQLHSALLTFSNRERRFGKVLEAAPPAVGI